MGKMLENDPIVDSLLAENPFRGKPPPKHVRARLVDVLDNDDDVDVLYIVPFTLTFSLQALQIHLHENRGDQGCKRWDRGTYNI